MDIGRYQAIVIPIETQSTHDDIVGRILDIGIIPILRTADVETATSVAAALLAGNIPVLEISLSVPGSLALIEAIADKFGNTLLLGSGTVLTPTAVRDAISAGARYIVAPDTNTSVIDECQKLSTPVFPGALTPSEISKALVAGADGIKVFPCNVLGGPSYIKSLLAPFPNAVLFPCGGVSLENAQAYLSAGARALFAGSALLKKESMAAGRFDQITDDALKLRTMILDYRRIAQ
jgi:2-dehydro-3-deoxyphosphogluconate aldolase/(4S)-4-hydroxy-2-oxoglutarate aldolase